MLKHNLFARMLAAGVTASSHLASHGFFSGASASAAPHLLQTIPLGGIPHCPVPAPLLCPSGTVGAHPVAPLVAVNRSQMKSIFLWSFFNVIIIYRVNIHRSYIDNGLQSTGAYSNGLR